MPQVYISEPNKHIEEYLDYYFDGKKNFEHAVLLNGAWGSGKTWFIKQYLEKKEDQGKRICYVSLNGIAKTSDIDDAIFKCIHPVLASKGAKLAGQILKGAIKATIKVDFNGDSKSDGSVNTTIPDIKLPDYLKINDNFILAFDDLERCKLKIEEVLGYINYFVEQENIKTLIISNETEIQENESFLAIKEKLIGTTFNYTEDQKLAIKSILGEVSNDELKEHLIVSIDLITQIFNQVGYQNLRSFKQAVFDFERFYKKEFFEWQDSFDSEIFEKILRCFLILSLENKKGYFEKVILEFKKDKTVNGEEKTDTKPDILKSFRGISSTDSENFMNKYQFSLSDFIFSPSLWNEILNLNIIEISKIKKELYEKHFRLREDPPIWFKLMDFMDLNESEFERLVRLAKECIEQKQLQNTTDILHSISMLIYLKHHSLIHFSVENLIVQTLNHIKTVFEINEKIRTIKDPGFREHAGQYGFYATGIKKFDNFMVNVVQSYEDKYNEKNKERATELFELMKDNSDLFYQRVNLTNSTENYYYDFPILKEINTSNFAGRLCEIPRKDTMKVLYALNNRYTSHSISRMYWLCCTKI